MGSATKSASLLLRDVASGMGGRIFFLTIKSVAAVNISEGEEGRYVSYSIKIWLLNGKENRSFKVCDVA
jgi:hypothetical protein